MDEMTIRSSFTRAIISKLLNRMVKKNLGYDTNIIISGFAIKITDEKAHVHVDADASVSKDELTKILQKVGF